MFELKLRRPISDEASRHSLVISAWAGPAADNEES